MLVGTVIVVIMFVRGRFWFRVMVVNSGGCFFGLEGLQVIHQVPYVFMTDRLFPMRHWAATGPDLVMIITVGVMSGHCAQVGSFRAEVLTAHTVTVGIETMTAYTIVAKELLSGRNRLR